MPEAAIPNRPTDADDRHVEDLLENMDALVAVINGLTRVNIVDREITTEKIANGAVTNNEVKSDAAIAYSKLAAIATGQLLGGNGGTPSVLTLAGLATLLSTGVLRANLTGGLKQQGLDTNMAIDNTTWNPLDNLAINDLEAGLYLIVATAKFDKGTTAGMTNCRLRLRNTAAVTLKIVEYTLTAANIGAHEASLIRLYNASNGEDILIDGTVGSGAGTPTTKAADGQLAAWRLQ